MKLSILALTVASASFNLHDDWRGDPCARAGIPWTPFSTHARLDPAALSRVMTRSRNLQHLRTKEEIIITSGTEDVIVVEFNVRLSQENLQGAVTMVQQQNDVALIIDGTGIVEIECVVSSTHVSLPPKLFHFIVDADLAAIHIKDLLADISQFDIISHAGSISVDDSRLTCKKWDVRSDMGSVALHADGHVANLQVDVHSGSIHIERGPQVRQLYAHSAMGSIHISDITAETVKLETESGMIKSELPMPASLEAKSSMGSVDIHLLPGVDVPHKVDLSSQQGSLKLKLPDVKHSTDVTMTANMGSVQIASSAHTPTNLDLVASMGSVHVPREIQITSQKRTITGMSLQGHHLRSPYTLSLTASTKYGSVRHAFTPLHDFL